MNKTKIKRAVAYIRVSTKSDTQLHSYDYQVEYYKGLIERNPNLEYVGIYSDWGISGRWLAKRPQLNQLLEDAKEHKFDVVYTKSVSRLSRNTTELLEIVRELRDLGVEVLFEKEKIDTFDPSAEVFLTIAAAVAENDLRVYSENQRWAVRKRFKNGYIAIGNKILGYKMNNVTNTLEIVEEEAKTVRRIYELYLQGFGIAPITLLLEKEGYKNINGGTTWSRGSVRYILRNEKYKGCSLTQKSYNKDGMKFTNHGEIKKYYMEDTHEPIISPEVFEKVQQLMYERCSKDQIGREAIPPYPFTGKIVCGCCGHLYNHKFSATNKTWRKEIWTCSHQNNYSRKVCTSSRIKDEVLKEKFIEAYNEFIEKKPDNEVVLEIKMRIKSLLDDERELTALKVNRLIKLDEFNDEIEKIRKELKETNIELNKHMMRGVKKSDYTKIDEFDETKVDKFIDHIVIDDYTVTFHFTNGIAIKKKYTNGPSGNQKGWKNKKLNQMEG